MDNMVEGVSQPLGGGTSSRFLFSLSDTTSLRTERDVLLPPGEGEVHAPHSACADKGGNQTSIFVPTVFGCSRIEEYLPEVFLPC